ncbi:MAG: MFS transporter [Myxococcota bacterium]|nr:MFS transporter [Myxococcota bacterium]
MSTPAASARLPRSLVLLFGAPGFAGAAMAIPIGVFMPRFYSDVVLVPLGAIAVATALARSLDALTDPAMGWLSDRTRSRWGRRKPYIALGVPLSALLFYALFAPPEGLAPGVAALWFAVSFGLFFLCTTIAEIPSAALGAELTPDYGERSRLFGVRSLFVAAGAITAALMPTVLGALGVPGERAIYRTMATLYGVVLVILTVGLLWRVPERAEYARRAPNPLVPGVRRALRNRPFRILLFSSIVYSIPAAVPAVLMPFFVQYVLQPADATAMTGLYLLLYLGAGLLFVPLWLALAQRRGKLFAYLAASALGIGTSVFYFFAGPGDLLYAGCIYFLSGTVSQVGTFLIPAMAADVIDYDELRTGKRREAQFTAFWALIPKFIAIPGYSVPLAVIAALGYVPNQPQSGEVLYAIRFMYSLFPAAFYVAAWLLLTRYPISERVHAEIRTGIAALDAGGAARDPLTGAEIPPRGAERVDEAEGWFLDHFSPGELRAALAGSALVRRVVGACAVSLGAFALLAAVAWTGASNVDDPAPLTAVFSLVGAGLALTAAAFHAIRVRAARRLRAGAPPAPVIRAHLDEAEPGFQAGGSGRNTMRS